MKKRDYIIIAGVIKQLMRDRNGLSYEILINELSIAFSRDNNNYNKDKFLRYIYEK